MNINGRKMSMLLYADDIILVANDARDLQRMIDMFDNWCKWRSLCVNPYTTKVMQLIPHGHEMFMFKCVKLTFGLLKNITT